MFRGKVIHGDGVGRELGYPTANLDTPIESLGVINGIYAAEASMQGATYQAALIVDTAIPKVEVFLFGYAGDTFYDTVMHVDPIQKVSDITPFENREDLKEKIESDLQKVRNVFDAL